MNNSITGPIRRLVAHAEEIFVLPRAAQASRRFRLASHDSIVVDFLPFSSSDSLHWVGLFPFALSLIDRDILRDPIAALKTGTKQQWVLLTGCIVHWKSLK